MKSRAKRYRGFPSQAAYRRAKKKHERLEQEALDELGDVHNLPEPYVPEHVTAEEHQWLKSVVRRYKRRQKAKRRAEDG